MNNRKRGLTLIEVVVSIFIVAFMLVGMMRLYSLGSIQSEIVRHKMMAINLAQAEIENMREIGFQAIQNAIIAGTYPLNQPVTIDPGQTAAVVDDLNGVMRTDVDDNLPEGYRIMVRVTWDDYYGQIEEVLESTVVSYF